MPYYNIQVVLALTVDINFVNLWYFKHSFTFDDYVTIFLQIPISCLTEFLSALERGYCKYNNPYHNHVHAADVTQTLHCLLLRSGLVVQKTNLDFLLKDKAGVITVLFNFLKIP